MNVLLISVKTLTDSSQLNANLNPKQLLPLIKEVQEMRVQPVIGTKLFNRLLSDINADALSGDYKRLLDDFISPALVYFVLSELPYRLNFQITNTGAVARTSESANVNSEQDLQKFMDYNKGRAIWYMDRARAFIIANISSFPEYATENGIDEIIPKRPQYSTGIYLGKSGKSWGNIPTLKYDPEDPRGHV